LTATILTTRRIWRRFSFGPFASRGILHGPPPRIYRKLQSLQKIYGPWRVFSVSPTPNISFISPPVIAAIFPHIPLHRRLPPPTSTWESLSQRIKESRRRGGVMGVRPRSLCRFYIPMDSPSPIPPPPPPSPSTAIPPPLPPRHLPSRRLSAEAKFTHCSRAVRLSRPLNFSPFPSKSKRRGRQGPHQPPPLRPSRESKSIAQMTPMRI